MTSEALNIKLQLDVGDITAGVKKVKAQLSGMADKVKQSIPKINTESKKAKDSLAQVGDAGDKVKRSMAGIGDEAKKSLSGVVAQSKRVTDALNAMGVASNKSKSSSTTGDMAESTGEASAALEELQGTMDDILTLNFFGLLSRGLPDFKKDIEGVKAGFAAFIQDVKDSFYEFDVWGETLKELFVNLKKNFKDLGNSLAPLIKNVALLTGKILALGTVLAGVLATINAIKVSKLAKELSTVSQQAGFSAQAYQEWAYVLEKAGIEASELGEIMKTLTESQVDVIDGNEDMINAYKRLGMSVEEVKSMNQEELWNATIKALQNIENTTERTSIAYKLFAEDTAKLTTVLNLSNEQTQQLIASYNQLGGAMSKELIHNSNVLQGALLNLRVAWEGLKNTLAQYVIPVVIVVVEWLTKAIVAVNTFLKAFFNIDTTPMTESMSSGMNNVSGSLENVEGSADKATDAVEKLKRVTMGFDELNIVADPNSAAKSDTDTSGTGADTGIADIGKFDTGKSVFLEASKQAEELKKKIEDFVEKFKTQIGIIGTALGALGVAKLIEGLGKALGFGDKFLAVMKTIKGLATSAIIITLQYTLVHDFLDKYIKGGDFKDYIKGLFVAALGTALLYATWGAGGLVLGLGVTAVAAIKAVIDNGGITNIESAVVALTGLASAIGAVYVAWNKLGLSKLINTIVAFGKAVGGSEAATSALAMVAPKLLPLVDAFRKVGTVVATFVSGLSAGAVLTIAGIITGIASAAYFLYENWEKVTAATKKWIDTGIKPILDDMKKSWDNLKDAVKDAGKALVDAVPDSVKKKLKEIWEGIKDVIEKTKEWFKSIDWIEGIGKVFETVGGIIVGVLGSVLAGAIQGAIKAIAGFVKAISGIVEIVSGVFQVIVSIVTLDGQGFIDGCWAIYEGCIDAFKGMYDATIGVVVEWFKGVVNWCTKLWDELVGHSIIPDMCEAIIEWFNTLYDNTIGVIVQWVKDVIAKVKDMWNQIKTWFNSNVAPKFTKQYWQTKFDTIRQAASDKLNAAKTAITGVWNTIAGWFKSNVAPKFTLSYWQQKFDTIRKAASEKVNAAKTAITGVWGTVSSWFRSSVAPKFTTNYWSQKFGTIKEGARSAFNGIISIVEKAINGIINKLNTLSWKIPDWVPKYGGEKFGFNLRTVSIPRLATGGIATSSVLANVGEAGREAILPLENNTGWMDALADRIAARNSAPTKVALVIDGKELGWATINNINAITKQTGGLQLSL